MTKHKPYGRDRRTFSPEFKRKIIHLASQPGANSSQISRDYDISIGQPWRWTQEAKKYSGHFGLKEKSDAQEKELEKAKRKIKRLENLTKKLNKLVVFNVKSI